jgi:hypothetical protein
MSVVLNRAFQGKGCRIGESQARGSQCADLSLPAGHFVNPWKALPEALFMKGFSPCNLKYMRAFAEAWPGSECVQEVLAQLPGCHQLVLLDKRPSPETLKAQEQE